jgi:hypothetical protein
MKIIVFILFFLDVVLVQRIFFNHVTRKVEITMLSIGITKMMGLVLILCGTTFLKNKPSWYVSYGYRPVDV